MALPFLNDNLINLYSDVLSNQETTPQGFNEDNPFRIPEEYLLSDSNIYTDPNTIDVPVEATEDGIASVNTSLPMYIRDDKDNLFSEYSSMDGAPAYIRPIKTDQPVSNNIKLTSLNPLKDLDSYQDLEAFNEGLSKAGMINNEMFIEDRPIKEAKEAKKTGIMQAAKDKGNALLDFIKGGGITGFALRSVFGGDPNDPRGSFLRNYYGGEDGSNLKKGTIQGGLMAGYNPVSGGLFGSPVTFGLQNAYDRRIATIRKTLLRKYGDRNYKGTDTKLDERVAKLIEEKRKEKEALQQLQTRTNTSISNEANQRYRDDPGAQSYSGGFDKSTNNYNDPFDPGETE